MGIAPYDVKIKNSTIKGAVLMNTFFELASERQSCRNYNPEKPVSRELLTKCFEAARLSPSACNAQPWHFHAVTSPEKVKLMGEYMQKLGLNKFAPNCPCFVVVTEEKAKLLARLGDIVNSQEYAGMDIGLAAAHFCLAAKDLGLSTCITGCYQENKIKELLGLTKDKRIRMVICTGYAADDEKLRPKMRKELTDIVSYY